ncbi:hypothetical protein AWB92_21650 [Mycobacterium sp. IEC1808]|uniref:hypothetical protein n=1 Tax=Mycobacterium sp. IEC1808 TaxID=1743230 RepID=UPI000A15AAA2|nr:hypothetical protein [Mycobacterium sp. IEC1808]ORW89125.1 hypothetical protein AWB92_21650 [Mycobacterium sp. IEC1808]
MTGAAGADTGIGAATGTAPPVEDSGAPAGVAADALEPWSTAADSIPLAPIDGATGGTTGAWAGGAADAPVVFINPCDKSWAPAAAG